MGAINEEKSISGMKRSLMVVLISSVKHFPGHFIVQGRKKIRGTFIALSLQYVQLIQLLAKLQKTTLQFSYNGMFTFEEYVAISYEKAFQRKSYVQL